DDLGNRRANAVIRRALALDNAVGGVAYLILNLFAHVLGDLLGAENAKLFQRDSTDPHFRPGDDFRIAVLAQHVSVDMMRIHAEVTAEQRTEPRRIERG